MRAIRDCGVQGIMSEPGKWGIYLSLVVIAAGACIHFIAGSSPLPGMLLISGVGVFAFIGVTEYFLMGVQA